jgi:UDP-glucose:(heptosyl)LPS alpha-1,3-glucosyltransferase
LISAAENSQARNARAAQRGHAAMRFAFGIVSLFPGGGLQRDCVDLARRIRSVGNEVTIFTSRYSGSDFADDLPVRVLDVNARTNHGWQAAFSTKFFEASANSYDFVVGFDKLRGLDLLYCADRSMLARIVANPLLVTLQRYRQFVELERFCFGSGGTTKVLLLSEGQLDEFQNAWRPDPGRLTLLPPTLARERCRPELRSGERAKRRNELGLSNDDWVWLAIGVQPYTKGFERAIRALRRFKNARLLIAGLKDTDKKAAPIVRLAQKLGVSRRVQWLGHQEEIPGLMAASDLLVHLARYDTTGSVILEAIVNGLPVISVATCGYAAHVTAARAGIILDRPFRPRALHAALEVAQSRLRAEDWSDCGIQYGKKNDLFFGRQRAAEAILAMAAEKVGNAGPRPVSMIPV